MKFLLVFSFLSTLTLYSPLVFAQNYTATLGKAKTETKTETEENIETKTLNSGKNYTAVKDLDEKTSSDSTTTPSTNPAEESEKPTECTEEHRAKLKEYDKLLIGYYEESGNISKNFEDFDNSKQFSEVQAKIQVYFNFIGSQEYKDSILLRQLCDAPAPPRPYQWPEWLPVPDPMDIGNGLDDATSAKAAAASIE